MPIRFRRYIFGCTMHHFYNQSNQCHPRLTHKIISKMHLRVRATNILILSSLVDFSEIHLRRFGPNFEIYVTIACLIFPEMHLQNKLIKHSPALLHNHICFRLQTLIENPFILNPHFHSKSSIVCFITLNEAIKVGIPGKYHLFQASFLPLILFLYEKNEFILEIHFRSMHELNWKCISDICLFSVFKLCL